MPTLPNAAETLNREFLTIRAKILEVAAAFDRLDRSEGTAADDPRMPQLRRAVQLLLEDRPDRAEQVQLTFSLPFDAAWQETFARDGWQRQEGKAGVKPR